MEQVRTMPEPNAVPAAAPKMLGPWTIVGQVGAGGMGVVYKAARGGRSAALKVIRPGLLDDAAVQARFAREVEVLRRVRDVHISEFLDADLMSDPAWLATLFIDGPNLRDHVAANGPLAEEDWWNLARGLSQALAVLEVHGITHRDMKPANVILAADGPVLIDFGIAVPEDAASLTGTGLVTGSPAWLSPEQANLQPISTASDIFSLGSLLAFAGTGRPPFGQGAHVAVLLGIATRDPDTDGLNDQQRHLLALMMAKDPSARPSAREVLTWTKHPAAALPAMPIAAGEATTVLQDPMSATQVLHPGPGTPAMSGLEATTVAPQAATAAAVAAATAAAATTAQAAATAPVAPPPAQGEPATPARRRGRRWLPLLALVVVAVLVGAWWVNRQGDAGSAGPQEPGASAQPTPGPTPPAPGGGVAKDGVWQLSGWQIVNAADGTMSVTTTVKNTGATAATGFATVYIYADGQPIGSASGQLPEVPAGGQAQVTLTGQDPWAPGSKSVSLKVQ